MDGKLENNWFFVISENERASLIKEKLKKYLPDFIDTKSEILDAILTAVSKSLSRFYTTMYDLKNANWTGKGLRLLAKSYRLFYKENAADSTIQSDLSRRYDILTKRGTQAGVEFDISRLDIVYTPMVKWYDNAGWVLDSTYPETDMIAYTDIKKAVELNVNYPILIGTAKIGTAVLGENYLKYIVPHKKEIREIITPINISIVYK